MSSFSNFVLNIMQFRSEIIKISLILRKDASIMTISKTINFWIDKN